MASAMMVVEWCMAKEKMLNPDGTPIPVIDSATSWAAAMLEASGMEVSDEEFEELVEVIRAADKRVARRDRHRRS